jgi:hypothetical protein
LASVEYPEKARRESMLWSVYDWFQQQADYTPILRFYDVEGMGIPVEAGTDTDGEADANNAERQKSHRLHLFIRLVNEGYIDADLRREYAGGPPFSSAVIRGLTERGLIEIRELPDPQQKIIQGLEANIRRIEQDPAMSPDRKQYLIGAGRQAIEFVREVGAQGAASILFGR